MLWTDQDLTVTRKLKCDNSSPIHLGFGDCANNRHYIGMTASQARRVAARLIEAANMDDMAKLVKGTD